MMYPKNLDHTYTIGETLTSKYIKNKTVSGNLEKQWKEYLDLTTRPVPHEELEAGNQTEAMVQYGKSDYVSTTCGMD